MADPQVDLDSLLSDARDSLGFKVAGQESQAPTGSGPAPAAPAPAATPAPAPSGADPLDSILSDARDSLGFKVVTPPPEAPSLWNRAKDFAQGLMGGPAAPTIAAPAARSGQVELAPDEIAAPTVAQAAPQPPVVAPRAFRDEAGPQPPVFPQDQASPEALRQRVADIEQSQRGEAARVGAVSGPAPLAPFSRATEEGRSAARQYVTEGPPTPQALTPGALVAEASQAPVEARLAAAMEALPEALRETLGAPRTPRDTVPAGSQESVMGRPGRLQPALQPKTGADFVWNEIVAINDELGRGLVGQVGRAVAHGAQTGTAGNIVRDLEARAGIGGPVEDIDPNSAVEAIVSGGVRLLSDWPLISAGAKLASLPVQWALGTIATRAVARGVSLGLSAEESTAAVAKAMQGAPQVRILREVAAQSGGFALPGATGEATRQLAAGEQFDPGAIAEATAKGAVTGAAGGAVASFIPSGQTVARLLAETGAWTVAGSALEGKDPTAWDLVANGVPVVFVYAATRAVMRQPIRIGAPRTMQDGEVVRDITIPRFWFEAQKDGQVRYDPRSDEYVFYAKTEGPKTRNVTTGEETASEEWAEVGRARRGGAPSRPGFTEKPPQPTEDVTVEVPDEVAADIEAMRRAAVRRVRGDIEAMPPGPDTAAEAVAPVETPKPPVLPPEVQKAIDNMIARAQDTREAEVPEVPAPAEKGPEEIKPAPPNGAVEPEPPKPEVTVGEVPKPKVPEPQGPEPEETGPKPPPGTAVPDALTIMREALKDAEPGQRHMVTDEFGKVVEDPVTGKPQVSGQRSTYPDWLDEIMGRYTKAGNKVAGKTRENADKLMAAIDRVLEQGEARTPLEQAALDYATREYEALHQYRGIPLDQIGVKPDTGPEFLPETNVPHPELREASQDFEKFFKQYPDETPHHELINYITGPWKSAGGKTIDLPDFKGKYGSAQAFADRHFEGSLDGVRAFMQEAYDRAHGKAEALPHDFWGALDALAGPAEPVDESMMEPKAPYGAKERDVLAGLGNYFGTLKYDTRQRVEALLLHPSAATWQDAHGIILSMKPGPGHRGRLTVWKALVATTRGFPNAGLDRVPSQMEVARALSYARDLGNKPRPSLGDTKVVPLARSSPEGGVAETPAPYDLQARVDKVVERGQANNIPPAEIRREILARGIPKAAVDQAMLRYFPGETHEAPTKAPTPENQPAAGRTPEGRAQGPGAAPAPGGRPERQPARPAGARGPGEISQPGPGGGPGAGLGGQGLRPTPGGQQHAPPETPEIRPAQEGDGGGRGIPGRVDVSGGPAPEVGGAGLARVEVIRPDLTDRIEEPELARLLPGRLRQHLDGIQEQMAARAILAAEAPQGGSANTSGTGVGKSRVGLTFAAWATDKGYPVLYVAPANALKYDKKAKKIMGSIGQDADLMGIPLNFWDKTSPFDPGRVYVMSYETFKKAQPDTKAVLILDECLPYSTPVLTDAGVLPIGEIVENRLAVKVWSFDTKSGVWSWKSVVRWVKNPLVSGLVRITDDRGQSIRCTPHHKIWTDERGYVQAQHLRPGEHLRVVPRKVLDAEVGSETAATVLREIVFGKVENSAVVALEGRSDYETNSGRSEGEDRSPASRQFRADAVTQPHEEPSESGEDASGFDRSAVSEPWRQWQTHDATDHPRSAYWVTDGACCQDSARDKGALAPNPTAETLQTGPGGHRDEGGGRGRWSGASGSEEGRARQEEGSCSGLSRVVGYPIHERDDHDETTGDRGRGIVYNLEVAQNHNYVAGGILVSNSHYLKNVLGKSARGVHGVEWANHAKAVLFMTATPVDKGIHIPYLARAGVFEGREMQEAMRDLGMVLERSRQNPNVTFWRALDNEKTDHKIRLLFERLTQKGLMTKAELSMKGVPVEFRRVTLPPEALTQMQEIAAAFEGRNPALSLMHQRRQHEPWKIPEAVRIAQGEYDQGRQVILFVSRINYSKAAIKIYDENGDVVDEQIIAESAGTAPSLKSALVAAGIPEAEIQEMHGNSSASQVEAMQTFQSGAKKILIATVESGGVGINLDDREGDKPRTMVIVTSPFSAVDAVQAAGRVWRKPTKSYPRIIFLHSQLPVDEWNMNLTMRKIQTLGAAVSGDIMRLDPGRGSSVEERKAPYDKRSVESSRYGSDIDAAQKRLAAAQARMDAAVESLNDAWNEGGNPEGAGRRAVPQGNIQVDPEWRAARAEATLAEEEIRKIQRAGAREIAMAKRDQGSTRSALDAAADEAWANAPIQHGYLYHATTMDRANDIVSEGLLSHKPNYGTDQQTWPDGAREKRTYFAASPTVAAQFVPEGQPVLLRVKGTDRIKPEQGTPDFYTTGRIAPSAIEALGNDNAWHSLNDFFQEPGEVRRADEFEQTKEGQQAVVPGTPKRAMPTQPLRAKKGQKEISGTPLFGQARTEAEGEQGALFEDRGEYGPHGAEFTPIEKRALELFETTGDPEIASFILRDGAGIDIDNLQHSEAATAMLGGKGDAGIPSINEVLEKTGMVRFALFPAGESITDDGYEMLVEATGRITVPQANFIMRAARALQRFGGHAAIEINGHYEDIQYPGGTGRLRKNLGLEEGQAPYDKASIIDPETGEKRVVGGVNKDRIFDVMGTNLYGSEHGKNAVQEAIQNGKDGIMALPDPSTGVLRMHVNTNAKTIFVSDNGIGMLPAVVEKEFVDIAGSYGKSQSGGEEASGAFGVGKGAIFYNAESIEVETVAYDPETKKLVRTTLTGSGAGWAQKPGSKGMVMKEQEVGADTPTGTEIRLTMYPKAEFSTYPIQNLMDNVKGFNRLPFKLDFELNGKKTSGIGETRHWPLLTSLDLEGAHVDLYIPPAEESKQYGQNQYIAVQVLNRGLPQFSVSGNAGRETYMPARVIADVRATVRPEEANYPFVLSREGLRGQVEGGINAALKDLANKASKEESRRMYGSFAKAPRIDLATRERIVDTDEILPPEILGGLALSSYAAPLSKEIRRAIHAMAERLAGAEIPESRMLKYVYAGFGTGEQYLGINLKGDQLKELGVDAVKLFGPSRGTRLTQRADGKDAEGPYGHDKPHIILINPWRIAWEIRNEVREGKIFEVNKIGELAARVAGTIVHELTHQQEGGHYLAFTQAHTRNTGPVAVEMVSLMKRVLAIFEKDGGRAYSELLDDVDRLEPYWNSTGTNLFGKISSHASVEPDRSLDQVGPGIGAARWDLARKAQVDVRGAGPGPAEVLGPGSTVERGGSVQEGTARYGERGGPGPVAPDTPAFRDWFRESKVVDQEGRPKVVFRGDYRADKVGSVPKIKKATSGRFYFTEDPAIASRYAVDKPDTHETEERQDFKDHFSFPDRYSKGRRVNAERLWYQLTRDEQAKVAETLRNTTTDDQGEIQYGTEPVWDDRHWEIRRHNGNWIMAGIDHWLGGAVLYGDGEEAKFLEILEHAGIKGGQYDNPWDERPAVTPVFLSIQHPLNTSEIPKAVVDRLREVAQSDRTRGVNTGGSWDKAQNAKVFMDRLDNDLKNGSTHAWTSMPEKVTKALQEMGYDGVQDTGGKMGQGQHKVWIAFEPRQIKSAIGNRGTFSAGSPNILQEEAAPYNTPAQKALGRLQASVDPGPQWYSRLSRAIEAKMPAKAPADQILQLARTTPGVKAEEIRWTGFEQWLAKQTGPVTKAEVLRYLAENNVTIEDVLLGPAPGNLQQAQMNALRDEWTRANASGDSARISRAALAMEPVRQQVRETTTPTQYKSYTLPGGRDYRELLLRWVRPDPKIDTTGWTAEHVSRVNNSRGEHSWDAWKVSDAQGNIVDPRVLVGSGEGRPFVSPHFNQLPNIVAHMRLKDRMVTVPEEWRARYPWMPKRIKMVAGEEFQSDWHEAGRERGYADPSRTVPVVQAEITALLKQHPPQVDWHHERKTIYNQLVSGASENTVTTDTWEAFAKDGRPLNMDIVRNDRRGFVASSPRLQNGSFDTLEEAQAALLDRNDYSGTGLPPEVSIQLRGLRRERDRVPPAPFQKTWPELALKRALRWGAEHGYGAVGWVPGSVQAERYNLSKVADEISYDDGSQELRARDGSAVVFKEFVPREKLPEYLGKELAERLLQSPSGSRDVYEVRGEDMNVGGHGMRAFYDKMLPNILNDYLKPWGVRVEKLPTPAGSASGPGRFEYTGPDKTRDELAALREVAIHQMAPGPDRVIGATARRNALDRLIAHMDDGVTFKDAMTEIHIEGPADDSAALAERLGGQYSVGRIRGEKNMVDFWAIPITPEMRASVLQGQPIMEPPAPYGSQTPAMVDSLLKTGQPLFEPRSPYGKATQDTRQLTLSRYFDNPVIRDPGAGTPDLQKVALLHLRADKPEYTSPIGKLDRGDGGLRGGALRGPESGVAKLLGLGIAEAVEVDGYAAFSGKRLRTVEDLRTAGVMIRNPYYETFYLVAIKDGKGVGVLASSSGLPAAAQMLSSPDAAAIKVYYDWLQHLEADNYALLHNHPSGVTKPSEPDKDITDRFRDAIPGFLGHVVMNGDEYSFIEQDGTVVERIPYNQGKPDKLLTPSVPHPLLGTQINNGDDLADFGHRLTNGQGGLVVVALRSHDKVRAIVLVNQADFLGPKAKGLLHDLKLKNGAGEAAVYATPSTIEDAHALRDAADKLILSGDLLDYADSRALGGRRPSLTKRGPEPSEAEIFMGGTGWLAQEDRAPYGRNHEDQEDLEHVGRHFLPHAPDEAAWTQMMKDSGIPERLYGDLPVIYRVIGGENPAAPPAPPDGAAFGRDPGRIAAEEAVAGATRPPSTEQVERALLMQKLRALIERPIGVGRMGQKRSVLGIFKEKPEVIRSRVAGDLQTLAHEVGHFISKHILGPSSQPTPERDRFIALHQQALDEFSQTHAKPTPEEGIAEWTRLWLSDPIGTSERAPALTADVVNRIRAWDPAFLGGLENWAADYRHWRGSDFRDRVLSHVRHSDDPGFAKPTLSETMHSIYAAVWDEHHAMKRVMAEVAKRHGHVPEDKDAGKLASLLPHTNALAEMFLFRKGGFGGAIDFNTRKRVGDSLEEVLAPVKDDVRQWEGYMIARRLREFGERQDERGQRSAKALHVRLEASHGVVQRGVEAWEQDFPAFDGAHDAYQAWNRHRLDYVQSSGLLSRDGRRTIEALNQSYFPFQRVMEREPGSEQRQASNATQQPIKGLKGSGREFESPLESSVESTYALIRAAERNAVRLAFVDSVKKLEGHGVWIERVPPNKEMLRIPTSQAIAQIREDLIAAGMPPELVEGIEDLPMRQMIQAFRPDHGNLDPNEITVLRNGKPEHYIVHDPELKRSLDQANGPAEADMVGRMLWGWIPKRFGLQAMVRGPIQGPARLLRAGVTLSPEFAGRNVSRDLLTRAFYTQVHSQAGPKLPVVGSILGPWIDVMMGIVGAAKGAKSAITRDQWHDALLRSGGRTILAHLDIQDLHRRLDDVLKGRAEPGPRFDTPGNIVKSPIEVLRLVSALLEEANRGAEHRAILESKGVTPATASKADLIAAGFGAADVTIPFQQMGWAVRQSGLNRIAAFFNPALLSWEKLYRELTGLGNEPPMGGGRNGGNGNGGPGAPHGAEEAESRGRRSARALFRAFMLFTVPSLALWWYNHDDPRWREIPQWQRDIFWIVIPNKISQGQWDQASAQERVQMMGQMWRVPKPFELGILFGSVPERVADWMVGQNPDIAQSLGLSLVNALGASMIPIPTTASIMLGAYFNWNNFFNRPIVSRGLEGLDPEFHVGPGTSHVARWLADGMSEVSRGRAPNMLRDPQMLDYFLVSGGGNLGRLAGNLSDMAARALSPEAPPDPTKTWSDIPWIRGFAVRYPTSAFESGEKFWEIYNASQKAARGLSAFSKRPGQSDAIETWAYGLLSPAGSEDLAGLDPKARVYLERHIAEIAAAPALAKAAKEWSAIRSQIMDVGVLSREQTDQIPGDGTAGGKKRQVIDSLTLQMIELAQQSVAYYRQVEESVKAQPLGSRP